MLTEGDIRTCHIHVVVYDSGTWHDYINMRDHLNSHDEDAQAYSELKKSLAAEYPDDRIAYTDRKSGMIEDILNKAREWRKIEP